VLILECIVKPVIIIVCWQNSTAKTPSLTNSYSNQSNTEVVSWVKICESAYCKTLILLFVHCIMSIIVRQIPARHFPVRYFPVPQFPPRDFVSHFSLQQIPVTRGELSRRHALLPPPSPPLSTFPSPATHLLSCHHTPLIATLSALKILDLPGITRLGSTSRA